MAHRDSPKKGSKHRERSPSESSSSSLSSPYSAGKDREKQSAYVLRRSRSPQSHQRDSLSPPNNRSLQTNYHKSSTSRSPEQSRSSDSYGRSRGRSRSPHHHKGHTSPEKHSVQRMAHGDSSKKGSKHRERSSSESSSSSLSSPYSAGKDREKQSAYPHRRSRSPQSHQRDSLSPPKSRSSRTSHHKSSTSRSPEHSRRASDSYRRSRGRSRSPYHHKRHTSPGRHSAQRNLSGHSQGTGASRWISSTTTPIAKGTSSSGSKIGNVPLQNNPAVAVPPKVQDIDNLTAEEKLKRAMEAARALAPKLHTHKATDAANTKYQVLHEKKKLMWTKKTLSNKWEGVSFGEGGEQVQAKFRRLMGMGAASPTVSESKDLKEKHDKLLSDMEKQYETSRFMTHLARGVGLGYGTLSSSSDLDNTSSSSSLP